MTFSTKYKPLFEVKILHRFYLNRGNDDFFAMNDADKEKQLAGYRVSNFLKVVPALKSKNKLTGHRLEYTPTNTGFIVWVQLTESDDSTPLVELEDTLELTFLMKLLNHTFFNFSNFPFTVAGRLFLLTNKRPISQPLTFPLIRLEGDHIAIDETFALDIESTQDEFNEIRSDEKDGLFGILKIAMKGEDQSKDVTASPDKLKSVPVIFEILLENRKTYWRYLFDSDQKVKNKDDVIKENGNSQRLVTKVDHPLTDRGFIPIELDGIELPNPNAKMIRPNIADDKIYSDIYM